jgi:hypothetical protein
MKKLLVVLLLMSSPAMAQQQFTLTLTEAEVNQIGNVMAKQPYDQVYQLIQKIAAQVQEQQNAAKAPPKELPKLPYERFEKGN